MKFLANTIKTSLMRFSQRIGITPIKLELEKKCLSLELKNSLWNVVYELIIGSQICTDSKSTIYYQMLWINFFKLPIDTLPIRYHRMGEVDLEDAYKFLRNWFFNEADWYLIFDFIEFSSDYHPVFQIACNNFLKREMSAYRFIDGKLVEIDSKEEIVEIETVIKNVDKFSSVKTHLKRALELLSDRKNPDYRNSIKESISAVESLSRIITGKDKSTLGQTLKEIEVNHNIPNSLKSAFSALYGYTSDEGGIRHGLLETTITVDFTEARFMLIACSAFVNYLLNKIK